MGAASNIARIKKGGGGALLWRTKFGGKFRTFYFEVPGNPQEGACPLAPSKKPPPLYREIFFIFENHHYKRFAFMNYRNVVVIATTE
jgi:hypothetical protein